MQTDKHKFYTYRLYDYRGFPDELANEVAIDDQVSLSRLRRKLLYVLPTDRSASDTKQLQSINMIIHSIRLLDRNVDDYLRGYRAYRQKSSVNNIILSNNYVLILAYEPSGICCATLYKRDTQIGRMFTRKFEKLCDEIIEDNFIIDNIIEKNVEYDGVIYKDKTIVLPLLPMTHSQRTKLSKNYHIGLYDTDDSLIRSFKNKKELEYFMKQELNGCMNYFDIADTENVNIERCINNSTQYQDIETLYERISNMAYIFYQLFWKRGNIGCEEFYNNILYCCDTNGEFCTFKWRYTNKDS